MKIRNMVNIAMFAAIICLCSLLSIPATIPFTLQIFAVFLTAYLMPDIRSLFSVLIYIALGAVGLPVFAGFKGGFGVLTSATGGFILGFILIPIAIIIAVKIFKKDNLLTLSVSSVLGLALCYLCGCLWFGLVYSKSDISFARVLEICVLPYVAVDGVKIALSLLLCQRLKKIESFRRMITWERKANERE